MPSKEIRKKVASASDPDTRAFIESLGLVEWGAALEAAKRLLVVMEAPAVAPEALERLQKIIRYHGEQHATLVIRTIIESEGNELALIEPVIRAVSWVMTRRPEWPEKGVAWIAAFDGIRDRTSNNRKFGELARAKCELAASEVSELIRVARAYGDREEITSRLSWRALVGLSGSLSAPTRRALEKRILDGERISAKQIEKVARDRDDWALHR